MIIPYYHMLNKAGPHWSSFLGQPTLADALNGLNLDNLPEHAALLGACEDGLPFLIDLANPVPGAILIAGDTRSGKTALIRSILASVQEMDSPEQVIFTIFTAQPDEYRLFNASANCQIILPVESKAIAGQIASLKEAAEKRKHLGPEDPCLILAIDDISTLLSFLDETGFASLYWLICHGPRYRIWTIASIDSDQIGRIGHPYLSAFRTRLFGFMRSEQTARNLAKDPSIATREIPEKGLQFLVPYSGEWLRFWICEPEFARPEVEFVTGGVS